MNILDVTQPLTLLLLVAAAVLLIFLGKEIKKTLPTAIGLVCFLGLVVIHSVQFMTIPELNYEEIRTTLLGCLGIDCVLIFISFFGYLWVDDISARFYKKKSIDNSLDWFWKEV